MNEIDKIKIRTEIEKNLHSMVCVQVKDHIRDFVMLVARKNSLPIEKAALEHLMRTTEIAIDDAFKRNVDGFVDKLVDEAEKYSLLGDQEALKTKIADPKE